MRINQRLLIARAPWVITIPVPKLRVRGYYSNADAVARVLLGSIGFVVLLVMTGGFGYLFVKWVIHTGHTI